MAGVSDLRGATVSVDTAPVVYYVEDHPEFAPRLERLFAATARGETQRVASVVTLLEVLVHPLRVGDERIAHEYNDLLVGSENVRVAPFDGRRSATRRGDPRYAGAQDPRRAAARDGGRVRREGLPDERPGLRRANSPACDAARRT